MSLADLDVFEAWLCVCVCVLLASPGCCTSPAPPSSFFIPCVFVFHLLFWSFFYSVGSVLFSVLCLDVDMIKFFLSSFVILLYKFEV